MKMRQASGTTPLAIASGINASNVASYLPFTECFLVATGVSITDTELDAPSVRELASIIHRG